LTLSAPFNYQPLPIDNRRVVVDFRPNAVSNFAFVVVGIEEVIHLVLDVAELGVLVHHLGVSEPVEDA
jgi:hypothetical protein